MTTKISHRLMNREFIRVSRERFEADLEDCLTILDYPSKNKKYYVCEYITPALYKKVINVVVY